MRLISRRPIARRLCRRGFTLVELLVVIGIVILLVSLLLPSLSRSREASRRAGCKSNLHQLAISHVSYANHNRGRLVRGQVVDSPGQGIYASWGRRWASLPGLKRYRSHGALHHLGFVGDPRIFYCPSWTYPDHQMGVSAPPGGGWFEDLNDLPAAQQWMQTSYHYRSSIEAPKYRPASIMVDDQETNIGADVFSDPNRGVTYHHRTGYNVVQLDGSVYFFNDPDHVVRDYNGGSSYNAGAAGYSLIESVWKDVFKRDAP